MLGRFQSGTRIQLHLLLTVLNIPMNMQTLQNTNPAVAVQLQFSCSSVVREYDRVVALCIFNDAHHFCPLPIDLCNYRHFLSLEAEFEDSYRKIREVWVGPGLDTLLRGPMGESIIL